MNRWFRLYDDTLNDPKTLKLSDKTFRIWIGILCATSKNDGVIPPFEDLVIMLRVKANILQPEIEKLIAVELIDHDDKGMRPHNWNKRQYKSDVSTERVKRFRNAERNVSETPPDTETDKQKERTDAAPNGAHPDLPTDEARLFRRGKELLGKSAGGLITELLKAKNKNVALARSVLEMASTKQDAREYIGAIIRGRDSPEDLRSKGEAW